MVNDKGVELLVHETEPFFEAGEALDIRLPNGLGAFFRRGLR